MLVAMCSSSRATSLPVRLSSTTRRGARGPTAGVQSEAFAPAADEVKTVAVDGQGRAQAGLRPVHMRVFLALAHDELPKECARFCVKTHHYTSVTLVFGIAGFAVVYA